MPKLSRRQFLGTALAGTGVLFLGALKFRHWLAGEHYVLSPSMVYAGENTIFSVYDLRRRETFRLEMPLTQAHSLAVNPEKPTQIFVFDSSGPRACEIDLAKRQVNRLIPPMAGNLFGGHGACTRGNVFYSTEMGPKGEGAIVARDARTLQVLHSFSSGGLRPHQMEYSAAEKALLVANEGLPASQAVAGASNFCVLDAETGKVRARVASADAGEVFRHFAVAQNGSIAIAAKKPQVRKSFDPAHAARLAAARKFRELYLYRAQQETYLPMPMIFTSVAGAPAERVAPEGLFEKMSDTNAVAADPKSGILFASHSLGQLVTFWNMRDRKLIGSHAFTEEIPRGVLFAPSSGRFYLHTMNHRLYSFAAPYAKPQLETSGPLQGFAHLVGI